MRLNGTPYFLYRAGFLPGTPENRTSIFARRSVGSGVSDSLCHHDGNERIDSAGDGDVIVSNRGGLVRACLRYDDRASNSGSLDSSGQSFPYAGRRILTFIRCDFRDSSYLAGSQSIVSMSYPNSGRNLCEPCDSNHVISDYALFFL